MLFSKRMRRDFCKYRIPNGALFSIIHNLNKEQSKVVSRRGTEFDRVITLESVKSSCTVFRFNSCLVAKIEMISTWSSICWKCLFVSVNARVTGKEVNVLLPVLKAL